MEWLPLICMLAPLLFPVLIWANHCKHSSHQNIRLEMLKSDQRIMDEFFARMRAGHYSDKYTGPVGPQGPQGLHGPHGLIDYGNGNEK